MDTRRATRPAPSDRGAAAGFAVRLTVWSLGLFGLLRLPWIAGQLIWPMTRLQATAGTALFGPSALPIAVTLACSGTDAVALCLAAIFAYPARWRARAAGAAGGIALILALNILRIGTLGRMSTSRWFEALHVYVWPAVLTLAILGFVVIWMRLADRRRTHDEPATAAAPAPRQAVPVPALVTLRFALVAAAFLLIFTLAAPLYLESRRVLAVAALVARAAAALLRGAGVGATANAGVLTTPGGAFLVTQECISTPLIPIYFAAITVFSARSWQSTALWTAAAVPIFVALGIARLLMIAIPAGIDTPPAFLIHAFSQLLVAAGMVGGFAYWRYGAGGATVARAALALVAAVAFVHWLGAPYTRAIVSFGGGAAAFDDTQGALMFLPAFQAGLFLALWIAAFTANGWRRLLCGAAALAVVQIAVAGGVPWLASHAGLAPLVRDIRAWALLGPALIIAAVVNIAAPHR